MLADVQSAVNAYLAGHHVTAGASGTVDYPAGAVDGLTLLGSPDFACNGTAFAVALFFTE